MNIDAIMYFTCICLAITIVAHYAIQINSAFRGDKTGSRACFLIELSRRVMFFSFESYIKRCSFYGLSESGLSCLGH